MLRAQVFAPRVFLEEFQRDTAVQPGIFGPIYHPHPSFHWWVVSFFGLLGASAVCTRAFESESSRSKRIHRKKERELQSVTERISSYAQDVHKRFPTGDVVVNERDLAEQLGQPIDVIVMALNVLLNKQRVKRVALRGYWKFNA